MDFRPRIDARPAALRRAAAVVLALLLAGLCYPLSGFANTYIRGHLECGNFQRIAGKYKTSPTSSELAVAYAMCLLARNAGEDVKALTLMKAEADKGDVAAAYWLAMYAGTGGTLDINKNQDNYEEARHGFAQVIHTINLKPVYPEGMSDPEYTNQYELHSHNKLVVFSYLKFLYGFIGSNNSYRLQSPTYTGDRDLELYLEYSPYILGNLKQFIENAEICANLPRKDHFNRLLYYKVTLQCRMMLDFAKKILPVERERQALLNRDSCARDVVACSDYQDVLREEIIPSVIARNKEEARIWELKSVSQGQETQKTDDKPDREVHATHAAPDPVRNMAADLESLERSLSRDRRAGIQRALNALGHDAGAADGIFGPRTRKAIKDLQKALGHEPTGYLNTEHLKHLSGLQQAMQTAATLAPAETCVSDAVISKDRGSEEYSVKVGFTNKCAHKVNVRWRHRIGLKHDLDRGKPIRCSTPSAMSLPPGQSDTANMGPLPRGISQIWHYCVSYFDEDTQELTGQRDCYASDQPSCPPLP